MEDCSELEIEDLDEAYPCDFCGEGVATYKIQGGQTCHYCGNEVRFCDLCRQRIIEKLTGFGG